MNTKAFNPVCQTLSLAMVLVLPVAAFAQADEDGTMPAAQEETEAPAAPQSKKTTRAPFPRVSDEDETIYAIQRKAYLIKKKWEFTPMYATTINDRFVETHSLSGSVMYHLAENLGLELYGGGMFPTESALTQEILEAYGLTTETAKYTQMLWAFGVGFQWSPLYGKIHLFDTYLGNFALYVGAGIGTGQTRVRCTSNEVLGPNQSNERCDVVDPTEGFQEVYEPASFRLMGTITAGMRFNFTNWLGLKVEVRDYIFSARVYRPEPSPESPLGFSDTIRNNLFVQVGVSFFAGGESN